jgi:hypothetical protein
MPYPGAVSVPRWRTLVAASTRLLSSTWGTRAAELGWSTEYLWRCHRERPVQRLDCVGAAWLLKADMTVALSADAIGIVVVATGSRLTIRRRQAPAGERIVLAWELSASASSDSDDGSPPEAA